MTRDEAREAILSHLRTYEKATDLDLIDQIGGDERLFRRLRSELIMDGLAKDVKGEGLAYTGPEETGRYDLFISYAHADNTDGTITALVEEIKAHQRRIDGLPMRIFFDTEGIRNMDDWEMRILSALRESRVMIAMLSPAYFKSEYCEKEWRWFVDHETERAMSMEAIAPVYTITVSGFEPNPEDIPGDWPRNLKRRQYLDARPWWNEGADAFARAEIRERLEELDRRCYEKVQAARHLEGSRSTIPPHNPYFVGRSEQIRKIREAFTLSGPSLVALHGLGGMGKSVLAHEYAHVYARRYPAGRFLLPAEGKEDLKALLIALAPDLGVELTDEERADTDLAHRRVCAALSSAAKERGGPTLVLVDNVDDPGLLTRAAVSGALPSPNDLHVIATTRLEEGSLQAGTRLGVGPLPKGDAEALFAKHRPFMDEDDSGAARTAAQSIARRLGCYPLAVELAAVYLRETPEVTYSDFLGRLEREGIGAVEGAGADARIQLSNHPETLVSALIEPTLARLSEAETLAVEYASVLPPDAVPVPWLRTLVSMERPGIIPEAKPGYPDPWRALVTRRLRGLRLLTDGNHPNVMGMHRVVQEVVRRRLGDNRIEDLQEAAADHAEKRAEDLTEAWTDRERRWEVTPLLRFAEEALRKGHEGASRLANFVQSPLVALARLQEAQELLTRSIALQKQSSDRDFTLLAISYSNLALIEKDLGLPETARELMQEAIRIQEATYDDGHPALADNYGNLAQIDQELSRLDTARERKQKDDQIQEAVEDPVYHDEDVQFTLFHPKRVPPYEWCDLVASAHLEERRSDAESSEQDPVEKARRKAKQIFGYLDDAEIRERTDDSRQPIPQGGRISFVPDAEGVEFNPPNHSFFWQEDEHTVHFRMRAAGELDGQVVRGRVSVFLGAVLVADLTLKFRVSSSVGPRAPKNGQRTVRATPYRKIFASYSRRDTEIVEQFEHYAEAFGDEYLRDVRTLRSGEKWNPRLLEMIDEADVFQLFWSQNSIESDFVKQEWTHALRRAGQGFIRPVYWEDPFPERPPHLPPPELGSLHFQKLPGPAISREEGADAPEEESSAERSRTSDSVSSSSGTFSGSQGGQWPAESDLDWGYYYRMPSARESENRTWESTSKPTGPPYSAWSLKIEGTSSKPWMRGISLIMIAVGILSGIVYGSGIVVEPYSFAVDLETFFWPAIGGLIGALTGWIWMRRMSLIMSTAGILLGSIYGSGIIVEPYSFAVNLEAFFWSTIGGLIGALTVRIVSFIIGLIARIVSSIRGIY